MDKTDKLILNQAVNGPQAWRGCDLATDSSWIHGLSGSDIDCLDNALDHLKQKQLNFPNFTREDFPIAALAPVLSGFAKELEDGRGFLLLRGLPVDRYSDEEIKCLYYGLGLNLGTPVPQNTRGDLIGLVMNLADARDPNSRVYETSAYLPYHTDPSDVVGLLCLQKARQGGLSSLVSAATVYNEILRRQPEILGIFYRPMYYAHLGEDLPSLSPVFSYHDGKLSCRYLRQYIELGHEIMGLPLSRVELAAFDLLDSIAGDPDLRLEMMLQPGDLQFANNYAVMHSRTEFEDASALEDRRKMLRLWLKMPNARQLAPDFPGRNGFPRSQ